MYGTKRKICTKDSDLFWRRENIRRKNSLKLQEIKLKCFYIVFICKVRVEIFANKYHSFWDRLLLIKSIYTQYVWDIK